MPLPPWPTELIGGEEGNQFTRDLELVSCFHLWPLSTSGSQSSLSSVLTQHPALCIQSLVDTHWLSLSGPYPPAPLPDLSLVLPLCQWTLEKGAHPVLVPHSRGISSAFNSGTLAGDFSHKRHTQTGAMHIPPEWFHSVFLRQPRKGQGAGQGQ